MFELPKLKQVQIYEVINYVMDSNCDYYNSCNYTYLENPSNETTQDLHAAQYGHECYVPKYKPWKVIEVPVTFKTEKEINDFLDDNGTIFNNFQRYNDYFNLVEKYKRNRFRSERSRIACIKAIKSILNGTPDENAIDYSTGRMFKK